MAQIWEPVGVAERAVRELPGEPEQPAAGAEAGGQLLLLTVPEAAAVLRVSRGKLYELIRRGELLSVLVGGSRRVPQAAVLRYVRELTEAAEQELAERRAASAVTTAAGDWRARWPELGLHRPA